MFLPSFRYFVLTGVFGLILCNVPLFDLLGYESSAATGVVVGLLTMWLASRAFRKGHVEFPLLVGRRYNPAVCFGKQFLIHLLLLLPPFLLLGVNALRVQNCDPWVGVQFWFLIPPVSVFIAQSVTWLGYSLTTRFGGWLAFLIVFAELIYFLWQLAMQPPIAGYSWLFGWFAGSIYDEALSVPATLFWARTWVVTQALFILAFIEIRWRNEHNWSCRSWYILAFGALFFIVGIAWKKDSLCGIHTHETVRKALGGKAETEHFIFYYSPVQFNAEMLRLLKEDAEFRYWELQEFFQEDPVAWRGRKIEVYVYPNAEIQQKLMGSRNTFVARPWTHQTHLRWRRYGDPILVHELAHLFTAPFGYGPLQMSGKWWFMIDTGLVEGIAVAADWPPEELNSHYASAAMKKLNIAPDLREIFTSAGFWSQPSRKAYTMTGSFVKWLVDEYGIEKFKVLYRTKNYDLAYGLEVETLIGKWEAFLSTLVLDDRSLALARYKYKRKSIFGKVCARTIGELQRQSKVAQKQKFNQRVVALQREMLALQPEHPDRKIVLIQYLVLLNQFDEAMLLLDELMSSGVKSYRLAILHELKGDILWKQGNKVKAREEYERCTKLGTSDSKMRLLASKLSSLHYEDPDTEQVVQKYLLDRNKVAQSLQLAMSWSQLAPSEPLPKYLTGLQLHHFHDYKGSLNQLRDIVLEDQSLEEQRRLWVAFGAFHLDDFELAVSMFTSLESASSARIRETAKEGIQRVLWHQQEDK